MNAAKRRARHLWALWQRTRALWERRRVERATRAELLGLDGRALRDLGLDRSQIPSVAAAVARRSAWQRS